MPHLHLTPSRHYARDSSRTRAARGSPVVRRRGSRRRAAARRNVGTALAPPRRHARAHASPVGQGAAGVRASALRRACGGRGGWAYRAGSLAPFSHTRTHARASFTCEETRAHTVCQVHIRACDQTCE
eukprot:3280075-Pleurochrysis_carterae.AAC.7